MKLIVKMSGQEARMALEGGSLLKLVESVIEEQSTVELEKEEPKKEAPKKKAAKKSKPTLVPDPAPVSVPEPAPEVKTVEVHEPPATVVEPEPKQPIVEAPTAPAPAQAYTIDDIQKAAVALVNKGKMADLQALLKEFNVSAITQLPDDMQVRAAFMHRVEVIGGQA